MAAKIIADRRPVPAGVTGFLNSFRSEAFVNERRT